MPKPTFEKIDFRVRDKLPFIFVCFTAVYMLIKDSKIEISHFDPLLGTSLYVYTLAILPFAIPLLYFHIVTVTYDSQAFRVFHSFVSDCKDNIISMIIVSAPFIDSLTIKLIGNFNLPYMLITLITYVLIIYAPLGLVAFMVRQHNKIIDALEPPNKESTPKVYNTNLLEKLIQQFSLFKLVRIIIILWLIFGVMLFLFDKSNWLSDWINSAVAIGTIGAVITSLYLSNISKKESLMIARKQVLYIGFEAIDMMSRYDFILKEHLNGNNDKEQELTKKINDFQWHASFNFNESEINDVYSYVFNLGDKVLDISLSTIQSVSGSNDDDFYRIYFKDIKGNKELETKLSSKLTHAFKQKNQENYFNDAKKIYNDKCKKLVR